MLLLIYFVFFDTRAEDVIDVFPYELGNDFVVINDGWHQELIDGALSINGVARKLAEPKRRNLERFIRHIRVKRERVIEDVEPAMLADYALDDGQVLRYQGQEYRWSQLGGKGYVWDRDAGRIYVIRERVARELSRYAGRLDKSQLINICDQIVSMRFDDLQLDRISDYGGWVAGEAEHRPAFNSRVRDLFALLRELQLDDLQGVNCPASAEELWRLQAKLEDGSDWQLQIRGDDDARYVFAGDQPVQTLSKRHWQRIELLREHFGLDYLLDIPSGIEGLPFNRIVISNGGREEWRLQRFGTEDSAWQVAGYSYWELIWPGGRESASPDVGFDFFSTLNNLIVSDVRLQPQTPVSSADPDRRAIACYQDDELIARVYWQRSGVVQSAFHRGKLHEDYRDFQEITFEDLLQPDSFLNRYLLPADVRRVEKLQRIVHGPPFKGELITRESLSQWFLSTYTAPGVLLDTQAADTSSCLRLAQHLLHMQAVQVRFADAALAAGYQQPQRSVDVRLTAWQQQSGEVEQFLEETLARDWGMRLVQRDGQWWALNQSATLEYRLADSDVALLFADVSPGYVFSAAPAQVEEIRISDDDQSFTLRRSGRQWRSRVDQRWQALDQLQIRRFLQALGRCRAERIDEAGLRLPGTVERELVCLLPGFDERREQITLRIGEQRGDYYPIQVESSSGLQSVRGIAWCPLAMVKPLLEPQSWFLPVGNDE